jgi:hypothetical protein
MWLPQLINLSKVIAMWLPWLLNIIFIKEIGDRGWQ